MSRRPNRTPRGGSTLTPVTFKPHERAHLKQPGEPNIDYNRRYYAMTRDEQGRVRVQHELRDTRRDINRAIKEIGRGNLPQLSAPRVRVRALLAPFLERYDVAWHAVWDAKVREYAARPVDDAAWAEELRWWAEVDQMLRGGLTLEEAVIEPRRMLIANVASFADRGDKTADMMYDVLIHLSDRVERCVRVDCSCCGKRFGPRRLIATVLLSRSLDPENSRLCGGICFRRRERVPGPKMLDQILKRWGGTQLHVHLPGNA
jgi:hypothetical protein